MSAGDRCGGRWNCVLPAGHNMGKVDIPENHQPPSAGDRDTLAGIARQIVADYALGTDSVHKNWRCGYPDTYGPCDCVDEFANDVADVLLASDWLREQLAEAWKEGHHAGRHDAVMLYSGHLDDSHTPNPYRTMEDTDAH